jgi:hypothetical protein
MHLLFFDNAEVIDLASNHMVARPVSDQFGRRSCAGNGIDTNGSVAKWPCVNRRRMTSFS